jgi:hypothetical protein
MDIGVERREVDPTMDEDWVRVTDDEEVLGVEAFKADDQWFVVVSMAEFVREEPLESELRRGVDHAIRSVSGVTNVWEEDREQWGAEGTPSGPALVRAVSTVIDNLADRARAHIDNL